MAAKSNRYTAEGIAVRARNPIALAARLRSGAGRHGPDRRKGRRDARLAIKKGEY